MMENRVNYILAQIQEGMDVYASDGKKIGTVDYVHFGEEDPTRPGPETTTGSAEMEVNPMTEMLANVFNRNDDMPQTVRARLLRYGFIRVDTGLLSADRFITPEEIAGISTDGVELHTANASS